MYCFSEYFGHTNRLIRLFAIIFPKNKSKKSIISGPDGNLVVKCTKCQLYFASANKMKKHRKKTHPEKIKCDYCDNTYMGTGYKKVHMAAKHNVEIKRRTFECAKCGKTPSFSLKPHRCNA